MSVKHKNHEEEKQIINTDNENTLTIPKIKPVRQENNANSYDNKLRYKGNQNPVPPVQNSPSNQNYYVNPPVNNANPTPNNQPYYNNNPMPNNQPYYGNIPTPSNQPYYNNNPMPNNQPYYGNPPIPNNQPYYNNNPIPNNQPYYNNNPMPNNQPYYGNNPMAQPPFAPPPEFQQHHKPKPENHSGQKKKKKKKHGRHVLPKFVRRLIGFCLTILLILFIIYSLIVLGMISKIDYTPSSSRVRNANALNSSSVTNVLLIGTDGRSEDEIGRSDSMILMSINNLSRKVTLTSFMRDCYVDIPGYNWDKLNAAYSIGGPDLLMDTIERNFGIRIDNYIAVNFFSFSSIVDSIGGIDLNITEAEAQEINTILMAEVNELMGDDTFKDLLSGGGNLHLNGKQALAYARIRYVGNADFERTERQREVISKIMNKANLLKPSMYSGIASKVMPDVSTNMNTGYLYLLSLRFPFLLGGDIEQMQIPADNTFYGDYTYSGDVLQVDFEANREILRNTIY